MIRQDQITSSYPLHLPYTRAQLVTERASLLDSGLDPDRVTEINEILIDVDEGLIVLLEG